MYKWDTEILYSQLGPDGLLTPAGLLDLFQNVAILHCDSRDRGLYWTMDQGYAWLTSRWRARLGQLPRCGQAVQVTTRAYSCRRALCRRAFSLLDENGQTLALADSLWTLIDFRTGEPADAADITSAYLSPGEPPDLGPLPRKIQLPDGLTRGEPFSIANDLLDSNRHVNNARSAALAMRPLPLDRRVTALAVDYHLPLLPGQKVTPLCGPFAGGMASALQVEGQICVSAQFWLD